MRRAGTADLELHGGNIPPWLFSRMKQLALPVVEAILVQGGKEALLSRMANPYWFQSFGAVIGMDWNSSGVTTAIMRALKEAINPVSRELGLYICGGKGKESLKTPRELLDVGEQTGLNGNTLARASKLSAKVDNTALQDGFNLYLHSFIVSDTGQWTVIQQGMHGTNGKARRYHWHSQQLNSFVQEPHTAICGLNEGKVLNLVDQQAKPLQDAILEISKEDPEKVLKGLPHLLMPSRAQVKASDVDMKRLGSVLWLAQENGTAQFDELLLLKGVGPRTLQSLALVSEIIHGTPSRFSDPARFSFAHGGKNGNPLPVLVDTFDESISTLKVAVDLAKIGRSDKLKALEKLTKLSQETEENFEPTSDAFSKLVEKENKEAHRYGGKTVKRPKHKPNNGQLNLFGD